MAKQPPAAGLKGRDHSKDAKPEDAAELTPEQQLEAEQIEADDLIVSPLRLIHRDWPKHWSHLTRAQMEEVDGYLLTMRNDLKAALNPTAAE